MDGEYTYFINQAISFFTNLSNEMLSIASRVDYRFSGNPHPSQQKICRDNAAFMWYIYDSEMNPARAGLQCQFEDHECVGSDNTGCTYCCMPDYFSDYY